MEFKKHGNGHNDHVTTSIKGDLPRIFHVIRDGYKMWTKNVKESDALIGYIDPGKSEVSLLNGD